MHSRLIAAVASATAVLALGACSGKGSNDAQAQPAGARQGGGPSGAQNEGGRPGSGAPNAGGGAGGGARRGAMTLMLSPSDVKAVERGAIEDGTAINGDLRPIEEVIVRARLEGNVVGVYAREGERVAQGQLLARFEGSAEESNRVSALADRESAQSELATAQWNAEQSAELFKAGAIAERDLKAAEQAVVAARARVAAAEARVRATTLSASDTRVLAPASGTIGQRQVQNGEHVNRGATLFTVVRNEVLELAASVPAKQANTIRAGLPVRFATAGRTLEGRVARVSPTINPATRAITVYVQVPNPDGLLKGNSFATGRIIARTATGVLVLPTAAIRYTQGNTQAFVYRIVDGTVERAPIELGIVDETQAIAEVTSGLAAGDRVVVGNVGALGSGMKVQVVGGDAGGNGNGGAGRGAAPRGTGQGAGGGRQGASQ